MRRPRVDRLSILLASLFIIALVLTAASARGANPTAGRTGSVFDEGPGGASVFRELLGSLGARTVALDNRRFAPRGSGAEVVFLLGASRFVSPTDVAALRAFADAGGRLVIATDGRIEERSVLDAFGVGSGGAGGGGERTVDHLALAAVRRISFDRTQLLQLREGSPLVGAGDAVLVGLVPVGKGEVIVVGGLGPFQNATIGDADNGRFAVALAGLERGGSIAFDEYHHGYAQAEDPLALFTLTWPGRAIAAAMLVAFLYLLLSGRRLGPPVPLDPRPARSSLDFIRGFAGLIRRSGHGEIARRRLREDLRRSLARGAGLDPATDLARVLATVGASDPSRAAEAHSIDRLLAHPLRDDALLRTVTQIDRIARHDEGRR